AFFSALDDVAVQPLGVRHGGSLKPPWRSASIGDFKEGRLHGTGRIVPRRPYAGNGPKGLYALHERHGAMRRAHFSRGDEIDEDVVRLDGRVARRVGAGEVVRRLALRPE